MIVRWKQVFPESAVPEHLFIPLRLDYERNEWVLLTGDKVGDAAGSAHDATVTPMTEIEAIRMCAAHVQDAWGRIARLSKAVLALCEHPEFEFEGSGIDADAVHEVVSELNRAIYYADENVLRLVDHPGDGDAVRTADVRSPDSESATQR